MPERSTELEYLRYFAQTADFGPADSEVRESIKQSFVEETGKVPPVGWYCCNECGEDKLDGCTCK